MIEIGDIYYIKTGSIDPRLDGCPVIMYMKDDRFGEHWRGRYQHPGCLTHDWFSFSENTIWKYLEKR